MKKIIPKSTYSPKKVKLLVPRVRLAMKSEFYLESLWLISLVIETRLRSLINRLDKIHPGAGFTFEQCLKRIKFLMLKLDDKKLLSLIPIELIDEIRNWKNQRNLVMNAIESSHVSKKRIQRHATEGLALMEKLDRGFKAYKSEWKRSLFKTVRENTPEP